MVFALLLLNAALVLGNWWLQPARATSWIAAGGMTIVMLAALIVARTTSRSALRAAADDIRRGVVFAGLMLAVTLCAKLAAALEVTGDGGLGQRATMVMLGVFFAATGNVMPKQLTPASTLACATSTQTFQRFAGWTWVLTGLSYSLSWLALPVYIAQPASLGVLSIGMLAILVALARLMRASRPA